MVYATGPFFPVDGLKPATPLTTTSGDTPLSKLVEHQLFPASPWQICPLPLLQPSVLRGDGAYTLSVPSSAGSAGGSLPDAVAGKSPAGNGGRLPRNGSRGSLATWLVEEAPGLTKDKSQSLRSDDLAQQRRLLSGGAGLVVERTSTTGGGRRSSSQGGASSASTAASEAEVRRAEVQATMAATVPVAFRRRTMAAIAGGGFRGPQAAQPRQCMCEVLKSRLARAHAEIRELRCGSRQAPLLPQVPLEETWDVGVQTEGPEPPRVPGPCVASTREAGVQVRPPTQDAGTQGSQARALMVSAEVQAGPGLERATAGSQTAAPVAHTDVQTEPLPEPSPPAAPAARETQEVDVQVDAPSPAAMSEASTQVESASSLESSVQAGCPAALFCVTSSQTDAPPLLVEVGIQSEGPRPSVPRVATTQTETGPRTARSVQTEARKIACMGVQVAPAPGVDKGTQQDDPSSAEREAQLTKLDQRVKVLSTEASSLGEVARVSKEEGDTWKRLAQSQALGRLNITILCPRAECTINGDCVAMDSWDPERLRGEFEREVLPRFSKLFVEEETSGDNGSEPRARSAVVDRTMQEFADVFRKRLTAMLAAPNAAAAVAAAGAVQSSNGRTKR